MPFRWRTSGLIGGWLLAIWSGVALAQRVGRLAELPQSWVAGRALFLHNGLVVRDAIGRYAYAPDLPTDVPTAGRELWRFLREHTRWDDVVSGTRILFSHADLIDRELAAAVLGGQCEGAIHCQVRLTNIVSVLSDTTPGLARFAALVLRGAARGHPQTFDWERAVTYYVPLALAVNDDSVTTTLMQVMADTHISPELAGGVLGDPNQVLRAMDAEHHSRGSAAHALLVQLRGADLGSTRDAWGTWVAGFGPNGLEAEAKHRASEYVIAGQFDSALDVLDETITSARTYPSVQRSLEHQRQQYLMLGRPAPPLRAQYWLAGGSSGDSVSFLRHTTLVVFTTPDCVPCQHAYPLLRELQRSFSGLEVVFVGTLMTSSDDARTATPADSELAYDRHRWLEQEHVPFPIGIVEPDIVHDSLGTHWGDPYWWKTYAVTGYPTFAVIASDGRLAWWTFGYDSTRDAPLKRVIARLTSNN